MLGEVCESDLLRALTNHQMDGEEALEDNGPGRVSEAVVHGPKDLTHASFSRMRGNQEMLDILCFRGRIL